MEGIYNRVCGFMGGNLLTISFVPVETLLHTVILDLDTENKILNELEKNFQEKTIIIISHKPKTLRICDQIMILENNTIKKYFEGNK